MRYFMILFFGFSALVASDLNIDGQVTINGKKAKSGMKVNLNDFITTGKKSRVSFRIGKNAFLAKSNTKFSVENKNGIKSLNIITGGVLAVFKKGEKYKLKTNNMTAGIRGTGIYLESKGNKSYFCTCYGETKLDTHKAHRTMRATHHNMVWVKPDGSLKRAKEMRNHTDDELRELELMVGRIPSFDNKISIVKKN